jgi:hypothetical protein
MCKKFVNNQWPTAYREQKYYKRQSITSQCGQYKLYAENEDQIIRCRMASKQMIRNEWRKDITQYLSEKHTPKVIREAICHGFYTRLESGRNTLDIPQLPTRNKEVMNVYEQKNSLGWNHFVRGRKTTISQRRTVERQIIIN